MQAFMVGQAKNDDVNRAVVMVSHPPYPAHAMPAIGALIPHPISQGVPMGCLHERLGKRAVDPMDLVASKT